MPLSDFRTVRRILSENMARSSNSLSRGFRCDARILTPIAAHGENRVSAKCNHSAIPPLRP